MIFATSHFYALGRAHGIEQAARRIKIELETPNRDSHPAVRTIARLQTIDRDVTVKIDTGATIIGKARCRAFHEALHSHADVWVAVDDDVEASTATLRWLLECCKITRGVVIAPYLIRDSSNTQACAVTLPPYDESRVRLLSNGGRSIPAIQGGFGLVAVHREAMEKMAAAHTDLTYIDDDGVERLAVFYDLIDCKQRAWYGEDLSFFRRLPSDVSVEALITGETCHAGRAIKLEHLSTKGSDE